MRGHRRAIGRAAVAVVTALLVASCSSDPEPVAMWDDSDQPSTVSSSSSDASGAITGDGPADDATAGPMAAWAADPIDRYFLFVDARCFCEGLSPYIVQVDNGDAVAAITPEGDPYDAIVDDTIWTPTTVEEIYELLLTYDDAAFGESEFSFTLDETGRWPVELALDPVVNGDDDELTATISLATEQPDVFRGPLGDVVIATGLINPWTPVNDLVSTVAIVPIPNGADRETTSVATLEALGGWVSAATIERNQILTDDLFVDPTTRGLPNDRLPTDMTAISLEHPIAASASANDEVTITAPLRTFDARVLATDGTTVTLLVTTQEAIVVASASNDVDIELVS